MVFSGVPEGPQPNCLWDKWRLCSALVNKWLAGQPWRVTGSEPRGGVQRKEGAALRDLHGENVGRRSAGWNCRGSQAERLFRDFPGNYECSEQF